VARNLTASVERSTSVLPLALVLAAAPAWCPLAPGVEYRVYDFAPAGAPRGQLHVVRIDPAKAELALGLSSREGKGPHTAAEWSKREHFVATINAGMFDGDHRSNVGRLVDGAHVNRAGWNEYRSVLAFGAAGAQLLDLDTPAGRASAERFERQVQNLRLIKGQGTQVWKPNGRAWSEAAVAQDAAGRLLFLFSRAGAQMSAWNDAVLALDLGVQRAMHVEGGPEASLSLRPVGASCPGLPAGGLDLAGSYETGFMPHDDNRAQWELPNVLGVRAVSRPAAPAPASPTPR